MPVYIVVVTAQTYLPVEAPSREAVQVGLDNEIARDALLDDANLLPWQTLVMLPEMPTQITEHLPPVFKLTLEQGQPLFAMSEELRKELLAEGDKEVA